jgi:hypothetical protein
LAKRNPNACTNTRFGVPICSLPDVLRRPPMHTGRKSWELLLRNRTWDARRATVGPHLAAISGKLRSLRVSAIGVCSTAPTGRGILPSWPCEFDSRHPLPGIAPCHSGIDGLTCGRNRKLMIVQAGHAEGRRACRPQVFPLVSDAVLGQSTRSGGEHQLTRWAIIGPHGPPKLPGCARVRCGSRAIDLSNGGSPLPMGQAAIASEMPTISRRWAKREPGDWRTSSRR